MTESEDGGAPIIEVSIMVHDVLPSDMAVLDQLRSAGGMTVAELSGALEVTATAVRQRLTRLLAHGYVERQVERSGRGRPSHSYSLTDEGRRRTGANFADLALVLWEELRTVPDGEVRRGLLQRISQRLAARYGRQVGGQSLDDRLQSIADLFGRRRVPFRVDRSSELPVLEALACPYPELAEQDRTVCSMERLLLSELAGQPLRLGGCRLDGESCCSFEPVGTPGP